MNLYEAAFGFGLVSASVIALAAVGFTMQFGITNMINLAYGQVMVASAYVAYYVNRAGITIWVGMLVGAAFGAVFSFLLNRFVYAPFMRKGSGLLVMVIVSLAVSLMMQNLMLPIVGYYNVSYHEPYAIYRAGGLIITSSQISIIVLAVAVMLGIHALLRYTRIGKAMRATSANPTLARNCGIPTQRVIDVVWLVTGALCGLAGVVAALNSDSFMYASGGAFLITALAAAVLGGAGQPYGAMLGAVVIGMVTELSAVPPLSANYKEVWAFGILVLVMVLRPQGLLAKRGAMAAAG